MSTQLERDLADANRALRRMEKHNSDMRQDLHNICGSAIKYRGISAVKLLAKELWDKHKLETLDNVTRLCSYPSCDCPAVPDDEPAECHKGLKRHG